MTSSESTGAPGLRPETVAVWCLIAAAAAFSLCVVAQNYWIDDSFISFRYAWHLVEGNGLVYNAGDPVEGYSNFLWLLTAAVGIFLGLEPLQFTQAAGLVAQAVTLWALFQIGGAAGRRGWHATLAPLFLAGSISFLAYPMTGMETSLFCCLLTVAFLMLRRGAQRSRRGAIALGLVLLAMPLTRFDGFVPVLLLVSYPLVFERSRGSLRDLALPLGICLAGLAAYNLWRVSYYPTLLPNTVLAKVALSPDRFDEGLKYLGSFAVERSAVPLLLALAPFALRKASPTARHLGWVVFGQAGYVALVGGDWMPHYRFLLPVLPLSLALMQEGWWTCSESASGILHRPRLAGGFALAGAFALHILPMRAALNFDDVAGPHFDPHHARRIGEFLDELGQERGREAFIAVEWGGIIPYYSHQRVLDTWGLTDRDVVRREKDRFPKQVWGTRMNERYLAARKPDIVAGNARILPTREAAFESIQPGGGNHYSYYPRMANEQLGYRWNIFQIADDAWWPALIRRDQ